MRRAVTQVTTRARGGSVSSWGPIGVVLVVVLSTAAFYGATASAPGRAAPSLFHSGSSSSEMISLASGSLALGEGPAAGTPLTCRATTGAAAVCATALTSSTVATSAGWANLTGQQTTSPPSRSYGRSMAFDPVDNEVIMFGGYTGAYLADTWAFHDGRWHQLSPATSPSGRDHSSLAWDAADGYLLLFGGSGTGGAYSDTWSFLNGTWTSHPLTTHPSGRWSTSMVYDAADGYILLFGGCAGTEVSDTWTYSGGAWTQLSPSPHPSDRGDAMMSYDPAEGNVLLFGGEDLSDFGDTWTYSAGNWTERTPAVAPSARAMASISYDSQLGGVVLFGGSGPGGSLGDTWLYVGESWTKIGVGSSPPPQTFGMLTEDPGDGYLLLCGLGATYSSPEGTWALYTIGVTATVSTARAPAPANVTLSASVADAMAPSTSVAYDWAFGDGTTGSGATVNHSYLLPGFYYATVTASDPNGVAASTGIAFQGISGLSGVATVGPSSGVVPLVVELSAAAVGGVPPYTLTWDLGGGATSALPSLNLTLTVAGTYDYGVTIDDSAGQEFAQSFEVVAAAPAIPALLGVILVAPSTGEAPLPVTFSAIASGGSAPYSYAWSFGDFSTSVEASATHTYLADGNFSVTCRISDASGQSVERSTSVAVGASVWATGQADATTGVATLEVQFVGAAGGGLGPYGFSWQFGDGATSASAASAHNYTAAGEYTAVLTVADALGHRAGWNTTIHVDPAVVRPVPPAENPTPSSSISPQLVTLGAELVIGAVVVTALVVFVPRRRR